MPKLEFWYDFASTYSYLAAMRIEDLAAARGVTLAWRPFLLGPIFKEWGWKDTPFRLFPAKGAYMARDIERTAMTRGLTFKISPNFPQNGVYAARLAMIGVEEGWTPAFTREVYLAQFRDGADIADSAVLAKALLVVGQEPEKLLERAQEQSVKDALRAQAAEAQSIGIFGAPTCITEDRELFWGDDRLEQALDWAVRHARQAVPA